MHLRNHENFFKMKHKILLGGGLLSGGFCLAGLLSGGICPRGFDRGFCPRTMNQMSYHLTAFELTDQLLYMNFPSLERKIFQKDLKSTLPSSVVL